MARRRFFVDSVHGDHAELGGETAQHLGRVLRAERGQRFEVSDNRGVYLAEIDGFGRNRVSLRILEELETAELPLRLHLLASLIKFDRFEWIIEKGTELGVETIIPVEGERSEKGLEQAANKRLERWRRIAVESSQQARRARLPEITAPRRFEEALGVEGTYRYFLEEQSSAARPVLTSLPDAGLRKTSDIVCLLVGPEGGWTESERNQALLAGWQPVSLGPQILRAETAAIAALAVLASAWDLGARSPNK